MSKLKVISGGQTGVDQAALRAAKQLGIQTGGWMPFGWTTEDGPRPEFAELYGMEQCGEPGYPARTRANVRDSDMTLWYGPPGSRGCNATGKACDRLGKHFSFVSYGSRKELCDFIMFWCGHPRQITLNFAGNRESGNPGIGAKAEAFFLELFAELKRREETSIDS